MKTVLVSGGFDPVHIGHLRMFQEARALGDKLIVVVNNDIFLQNKKGYVFMPELERKEIIEGFSCVDEVILSIDKDATVCESLVEISKGQNIDIFANGGDRKNENDIPEAQTCSELDIEMIFNIGGGKIQSSSELGKQEVSKPWGNYRTYEKRNGYLSKRITVNPGQSLSLQSHEHRSEFWIICDGEALVTCDEKENKLTKGDFIVIPQQSKHRLINESKEKLEILEVQFGNLLSEEDIVRYEDIYGRS